MISLRPERKLLNMCFKRIEAVVTLRISHSLAYFQAADRVLAEGAAGAAQHHRLEAPLHLAEAQVGTNSVHLLDHLSKWISESESEPNSMDDLHCRFGIPEEGFAETLFLCRKCRSLYWRSLGHPCLALKTESGEFLTITR